MKTTSKSTETMRIWLWNLLLMTAVILFFSTVTVKAEDITIQCGDNAYATLNSVGTLTISGSGDMWNCTYGRSYFYDIRDNIYKVVVENGITSIGAYTFTFCYRGNSDLYGFSNLQSVTIGTGVREIGAYAFYRTYGLFSINIPGNVQTISESAFRESGLKSCTLNKGLETIGECAFYGTGLKTVVIPDGVTAIKENAFNNSSLTNVTIPVNIGVIENMAFGYHSVSATIYSKSVIIVAGAFDRDSSFTAIKGSSADVYASNYGQSITYFQCVPSSGIPSLNHNYDTGKVTKAATCTATGVKTYTCTKCGGTKTETIGATGHSYGTWKTTKAATVLKTGTKVRTCNACGAKETQTIAKLKPTIKLNVKTIPLRVGKSTSVVKVASMGAGDYITSWKSSNPQIVSVNNKGVITAKKVGTATITVKLKSGISASVKVKTRNAKVTTTKLTVSAKGVTLKNKSLTLKKGSTCTLTAKVTPLTSENKVSFSSSKKSVATVSPSGKVTTKKKGKTKITVKSGEMKVVLTVTVK